MSHSPLREPVCEPPRIAHIQDIALRCPRCFGALLSQESQLRCVTGEHFYPIVNGVPILIADEKSVFTTENFTGEHSYAGASHGSTSDRSSGLRRTYRRLMHRLSMYEVAIPYMSVEVVVDRIRKDVPRPRALVLGAGDARYTGSADYIYTDVSFSEGIYAIADAHDIPFADGEFDLVIAVAVLEHVIEPTRVVEEIWRVLKPHGYVYAVTPFLQAVHMGAHDFTRFTYLGHRALFKKFDEYRSGLALGPASALAQSLQGVLLSLSDRYVWRLIARAISLLVAPLVKQLDWLTRNTQTALDSASAVYFCGQRRETPIPPCELLRLYRGGFKGTKGG